MNWKLPEADTYFGPILAKTPEGFEIDHLDYALRFCKNFRTAIDGGAHIGTWTVHLARLFQKVVAYEPADDTFECLAHNTAHLPNVTAIRGALGFVNTYGTMVDDPTRVGNTGSRMVRPSEDGFPIRRLDSEKFPLPVDLLKLDLEGSEFLALDGARGLLARDRPVLIVEHKEFKPPRCGGVWAVQNLLRELCYQEVGRKRNDAVYTFGGQQ